MPPENHLRVTLNSDEKLSTTHEQLSSPPSGHEPQVGTIPPRVKLEAGSGDLSRSLEGMKLKTPAIEHQHPPGFDSVSMDTGRASSEHRCGLPDPDDNNSKTEYQIGINSSLGNERSRNPVILDLTIDAEKQVSPKPPGSQSKRSASSSVSLDQRKSKHFKFDPTQSSWTFGNCYATTHTERMNAVDSLATTQSASPFQIPSQEILAQITQEWSNSSPLLKNIVHGCKSFRATQQTLSTAHARKLLLVDLVIIDLVKQDLFKPSSISQSTQTSALAGERGGSEFLERHLKYMIKLYVTSVAAQIQHAAKEFKSDQTRKAQINRDAASAEAPSPSKIASPLVREPSASSPLIFGAALNPVKFSLIENPYVRVSPFKPTPQTTETWLDPEWRGNPPPGVIDYDYVELYHYIKEQFWREEIKGREEEYKDNRVYYAALTHGVIRDRVIAKLLDRGKVSPNWVWIDCKGMLQFRDVNP